MTAMNVNTTTYVLAATSTSSRVELIGFDANQMNVIVTNVGNVPAFVTSGDSTVTAVYPTTGASSVGATIPAGGQCTFTRKINDTHIAAITASGSADLHIKVGAGE